MKDKLIDKLAKWVEGGGATELCAARLIVVTVVPAGCLVAISWLLQ